MGSDKKDKDKKKRSRGPRKYKQERLRIRKNKKKESEWTWCRDWKNLKKENNNFKDGVENLEKIKDEKFFVKASAAIKD